jgi:hypothetical protein
LCSLAYEFGLTTNVALIPRYRFSDPYWYEALSGGNK